MTTDRRNTVQGTLLTAALVVLVSVLFVLSLMTGPADFSPRTVIAALFSDQGVASIIVRDIRLPLLSSSVLFLTMMTILLGAQWSFAYINVLTQGGPLGSTTNIYYLLWDFGFSSLSVGWSSASAVVLFAAFGAIAFLLLRLIDRFSFHDN